MELFATLPAPPTLMTFFAAAVLLGLAPGPDNLFVLTQSMQAGVRAGLLVVLGLCSGLVVHTLLVAGGLAALLAASPKAFTWIAWGGAAYLVWLAWGAATADPAAPAAGARSAGHLYARGVIMNLSNPKVLVFFLAFLPQFTEPARGAVSVQLLALGALFIVATLLTFGAIALAAGRLGGRITRHPGTQRWLNRIAAGVFLALALRLLLDPP